MNIGFSRVEVHLGPREVLRVYDPVGARIECVRGGLWITQDRDLEDHFLSASDALVLDRRGLALIHAQEPSDVVLQQPARRPSVRQRVARWIARTFGPESLDRPRRLAAF
ncbi:MAG TPA: DUF2917 domain-containing protein [Burkholderiales bacterium]|nr:DUF2917 domain-containing protein [Burkholderiales bacterium]